MMKTDRKSTTLPSRICTLYPFNRYLLLAGVLIVTLLVAVVGIYAWYVLYRPCDVEMVDDASATLISQASMYDRVYQSAINASPTTLDGPVVTMQQIFMDTNEVVVPVCTQTAKQELLNYMSVVIHAFRVFAAGEPDGTVRDLVARSNMHYDGFIAELKAVKKCAPFCLP